MAPKTAAAKKAAAKPEDADRKEEESAAAEAAAVKTAEEVAARNKEDDGEAAKASQTDGDVTMADADPDTVRQFKRMAPDMSEKDVEKDLKRTCVACTFAAVHAS